MIWRLIHSLGGHNWFERFWVRDIEHPERLRCTHCEEWVKEVWTQEDIDMLKTVGTQLNRRLETRDLEDPDNGAYSASEEGDMMTISEQLANLTAVIEKLLDGYEALLPFNVTTDDLTCCMGNNNNSGYHTDYCRLIRAKSAFREARKMMANR